MGSLTADGVKVDQIIDETYLRCLSRYPTERERRGLLQVFEDTPPDERREGVEDLLWALMTSREFLFQH